jgi:transposase-like protein
MNPVITSTKKNASRSLKLSKSIPNASNADIEELYCRHCKGSCVKAGKERSGKQRYKCTTCEKRQVFYFKYKAYNENINQNIIALTKEGVGIRGTARLLSISTTTLLSRIKKIASDIKEPALVFGKEYEVDELRTYVKKKES